MSESIKHAIHSISEVLEIPAIIVLMFFVLVVVLELGSIIVEGITERRKARIDTTEIMTEIRGKDAGQIGEVLRGSNFGKSKKRAFEEFLAQEGLSRNMAEVLAMRLISSEELRLQRKVVPTDVITRVAPLFGLMATLIPLGPGLIALGQGDTKTLSVSLLTAFDATVSGLAAAGVAFVISKIRKRWYEDDLISMETVMEAVLEELYREDRKPIGAVASA